MKSIYVYYPALSAEIQTKLVERALSQFISAFGPSIVPTIYDDLERISKEETDELKKRLDKARR